MTRPLNSNNAARINQSWERLQRRQRRVDWQPLIGWACIVLAGVALWGLL